ncbi:hypothetical protein EBQ26_09530 [Allofranklinella schreckenbergeri]|uniref:Uncharacterized protein n=1 Tax=Allofranklinella schreckenbergeri TaxID=1076744 RepID=A0A3M6Q2K7_9BURK|nr:hypothetical protein EBQ26_09530 [Allofranklinella schreckenbergeri]
MAAVGGWREKARGALKANAEPVRLGEDGFSVGLAPAPGVRGKYRQTSKAQALAGGGRDRPDSSNRHALYIQIKV